ncbi:extracellular solute-binding protein [Marispirochaeta aestuarii]|uniref:ABC transporter substrate-binding protein n=1 Tax=Marispirochaeta aestuarii TaxID=1963862 RepID=UPI0029C7BFB4|nr:extracellular solute-binding protein [Marispirochaeta aestuarii]
MKKSLYLVVVLLAVSMSLYSAGEQEAESGDTTVVRVWANDAHNKPEYTSTIQEFMDNEGKELGIKIDHQVYGGDYYNSLDIAIAAGEEPHVFKSRKSGQYAEMGKIIPLKELPGGQELIDETAGLHMEDVGMFNGEVYAIPIRVTTQNLIYNKELFNELNLKVPESWADMREAAKKITEAGKGRVYGFALPLKYANYKYYFVGFPAAPSIGHQFFNHKTGRFDFMSLSPYFDFIQQMIDDGSMFPGIENLDFDTMRAQFAAGNIGMLIGNSFDVGVLYDQFPAQMEWGVAPIPVMDPNNRYKQVGNPGAFYVISSKVKEEGIEDEVMEVYKKLVSIEHLAKTYENGKDIPIRGEEVTSHAAEPSREQFKAFADLTNVYIKPAYPESKIRVEGESYSDVFSKIITGRVDTEKALADLDERYNKAIDEAIDNGRLDISQYIDPNYDEKVKYVR